MAQKRVRVAFEFMEKLRRPFFCFHDRDVAPEGATLAETNKNLDAVVKVHQGRDAADRHQAALGHGQSLQQSALRPRRRHEPQRRLLRLRRRPRSKKALEVTKELGGAGLHVLGRPRRLPDPLEHRHEARVRPPGQLHAHGRRLRQADRLHRPVLFRAQAQGADQAPVRLRLRRLHQFPPRLRPGRPREDEHRNEPRHAGRPHRRARDWTTPARRASWARSTPTRATCCWAGTPTSSPPTST